MTKHNQDGAVNTLAISLGVSITILIAVIAFAGWAYSSRQDFKNNVVSKVNTAVSSAKLQEDALDNAKFQQQLKSPFRTYTGPAIYGTISLQFPNTWSAYVDDTGSGSALVNGYFAPYVVPSVTSTNSVFSLQVQVVNQTYAQTVANLQSEAQSGQATVTAYSLPKLPGTVGVEATGDINNVQGVTEVVLPIRAYTLVVSTQGNQYLSDFNNIILQNLTFKP